MAGGLSMTTQIACIPVTADDQVAHGWGKAPAVAVVEITDGAITAWRVEQVGWDVLHDSGEGNHHARVVRFLQENNVTLVAAQHMGDPMVNTLTKLGVHVVLGADGDARAAVVSAASSEA
jgi:predicted Fe-Mo cluster-binding NifX family protein